VKHGKTYANLEEGDDVLTIGLNRAVTLIAEKKANPKKGRRFGADPGKILGEHPDKGGPVVVKNGRYGPYVSHNGINATITGDKAPETITCSTPAPSSSAHSRAAPPAARRRANPRKPRKAARKRPPNLRTAPRKQQSRAKSRRKNRPKSPPLNSWRRRTTAITFMNNRAVFGAGLLF
jgi:DNA topoisomerase-1